MSEAAADQKASARQGLPSPELLRQLLDYDPETGALTWMPRSAEMFRRERDCRAWNARFAGAAASSLHGGGYLKIQIFGRLYYAHRVAFALHFGEWPAGVVDHINGRRDDNRSENLRSVTGAENRRNSKRSKANTSGIGGIYWCKNKSKWRAHIGASGRLKNLGYFTEFADACAARAAAEVEHSYHPNHGRT